VQRLGLRAFASDLNPVAVLISKALVEIPPKFAGRSPINPESQAELKRGGKWNGKGAQGLAEDVRYYGRWMRDEAERRIGLLYPKAQLPDGSEATVIAWIWARTVRSPDPAAKGAMVPLISSFMLSSKEGKKAWVEPIIDSNVPGGYRFQVMTGVLLKSDEERFRKGTKSAKAEAFVCLLTGSPIDRGYVQAEGKADRLGTKLMAIVAEGKRKRIYISPNQPHEQVAANARNHAAVEDALKGFLSPLTPTRAMITGGVCSAYGLNTWGKLFTPRQLVALVTLSDLIAELCDRVKKDAIIAGLDEDGTPLHLGGGGAEAYADSMSTYLAFAVDRNAQTSNALVRWFPTGEKAQPAFERHALPIAFDFAEANVFASSTGSFDNCLKYLCLTLEKWGDDLPAKIEQRDARFINEEEQYVIATDPPYYDNIGYAVLADFFYLWLKRSLSNTWPDLFRRLVTPKDEELVASPYRHGGKAEAEAFFMNGMKQALAASGKASRRDFPLAIFYAFKQSEAEEEGTASAGWASFLQAIVDAGLAIDGTWPARTEHSSRMIGQGANVLASSIVLVCRRRAFDASLITRVEFIRALKRELPDAIDDIRKAGVGPVDMQQAVIGPGMGVFTQYSKVIEDDDSAMSVKTALALINRVWQEIESELDARFDAETQVALAWFSTYGLDYKASGELIMLANAKDVALNTLTAARVFEAKAGKARLLIHTDFDPAQPRAVGMTVWEGMQRTAAVVRAEEGGAEAAARIIQSLGSRAADARKLAYRLYEICAQKGWNQEALVYNELAQEWPRLEELAQSQGRTDKTVGAEQPTLF
jgi:putative DNA methylase